MTTVNPLYGWMDRNGHVRVFADKAACLEKHTYGTHVDEEGITTSEYSPVLEFICMTPEIEFEVRDASI